MRVFRFTGGEADHLNAQVRKHHHLQGHQHALHAIGHEAAVGPQVGNTQRDAIVAKTEGDDTDATEHHRNDGHDLDQGKPELELTERLDRDQVDRAHADQRRERPDPARDIREPDPHVHRHRRDFRDAGHQPQEPVVPARQKARQRAQIILCVAAERAGYRVVHGHFAERAHDHQNGQATDDVRQHDGRACHFNCLGRAQEQADADTGAKRHQANVTLAQFTLERTALSGVAVGLVVADWHKSTTSYCYWMWHQSGALSSRACGPAPLLIGPDLVGRQVKRETPY